MMLLIEQAVEVLHDLVGSLGWKGTGILISCPYNWSHNCFSIL